MSSRKNKFHSTSEKKVSDSSCVGWKNDKRCRQSVWYSIDIVNDFDEKRSFQNEHL